MECVFLGLWYSLYFLFFHLWPLIDLNSIGLTVATPEQSHSTLALPTLMWHGMALLLALSPGFCPSVPAVLLWTSASSQPLTTSSTKTFGRNYYVPEPEPSVEVQKVSKDRHWLTKTTYGLQNIWVLNLVLDISASCHI